MQTQSGGKTEIYGEDVQDDGATGYHALLNESHCREQMTREEDESAQDEEAGLSIGKTRWTGGGTKLCGRY